MKVKVFLVSSIKYRQETTTLKKRSTNCNCMWSIMKYEAEIIFKPAFGTLGTFWKDSPVMYLHQAQVLHKQVLLEILPSLCSVFHIWLVFLVRYLIYPLDVCHGNCMTIPGSAIKKTIASHQKQPSQISWPPAWEERRQTKKTTEEKDESDKLRTVFTAELGCLERLEMKRLE